MAYSMHMVKVPGTHCRKKCGNKAIKLLFWGLVTKLSNHNLKLWQVTITSVWLLVASQIVG